MKKLLLGGISMLFLIAIMASGCAEKVESRGDKEIKLTPLVGKQTRATEFTYWEEFDEITVTSYTVGATLPFKVFTLTYGGGGTGDWGYGTSVVQPGVDLVFYSYSPEDNVTANLDGTKGTLAYAVQDEDDQEDLIAATITTGLAEVTLGFDHLLSQINFAIQGAEGVKYQVTNISINNVADEGTYTFGTGWGVPTGEASYEYTPAGANTTDGLSDDVFYLGNMGGTDPLDNANDNALMLMPQEFVATGSTITFNYETFGPGDESLSIGSAVIDLSELEATKWFAGKRYLYVIDFTGDAITFIIIVNPWNDGDVIDVKS